MPWRKRAYLVLVLLLAFSLPRNAKPQVEPAFCPVVATHKAGGGNLSGYLLGGWSQDGWLPDQAAARLLRGGEEYRFYSLTGELGAALGNTPHPYGEEDDTCHETLAVSFANSPVNAGGLVAVGGSFNALGYAHRGYWPAGGR